MMYASQEIPHRVLGTNETTSVDGKKTEPCCSMAAEASRVLDDDNLLREILVRVGFPTTLVCATLVCKRWYHHASEPAFLCRFRKLNPPRLLGFYVDYGPYSVPTTPCFVPMPFQAAELAAVVRRVSSYSFSHHDIVGSRIARTASSPPHCSATKAASSSRGQMIIGFQLLYTLS